MVHDGKPQSSISIAICAFNALEYTQLLIDSIRRHSSFSHEILIYSDGSSDATAAWLKEQPDIIWRHDRRNRGICTAMNRVAKLATREYLFFPNTDHVLPPGWDERLVPRLGPRRVVSLQCIEPGTVPVASIFHARNCGTRWDEFDEPGFHKAVRELSKPHETPGVNYPFVLSRTLWQNLGGLDERFDPGPANDPDLFYRMNLGGIEMVRAEDVLTYHFSGKSSRMAGEAKREHADWHAITDRNEARFVEKWGEPYQYANGGLPSPGTEARKRWVNLAPPSFKKVEVRSPLKIGVDARAIRPGMGGIGVYASNLLNALAKLPEDLELHCFTNHPNLLEMRDSRRASLIPHATEAPEGAALEIEETLPPDAAVFHGPSFVLPDSLKCPGVVTIHDLAFMRHPEWYPKEFVSHLERAVSRSLKTTAAVIAVSNKTKSELYGLYPHLSTRVFRIYEAMPEHSKIALEAPEAADLRRKHIPEGEFILSVGVQQRRKNATGLVEAFTALRDKTGAGLKLLLVGGKQCEDPGLARILDSTPIAGDIVLTGHLPARELAALYSTCKLFVYPSQDEGFGLPLLEAMWHGAPVVCSDSGALPEVAGDAGLIYRTEEPGDLVRAMSTILGDDGRRTDLIARGRKRVQEFSWEKVAKSTLEVYRSVLKSVNRGITVSTPNRSEPPAAPEPVRLLAGSRSPERRRVAIDARLFGQDRLGTGRYTSEIVKAMCASARAEVVLIGPKVIQDGAIPGESSVIHHIPVGMETLLDASWEQFSLSSHLLGCDAYFSPTGILPIARPCKGVAVVHDLGFNDHPEHYEEALRKHLERWVRASCTSADRLVAVSEFTRGRVRDLYGVPGERISVVHHGNTTRLRRSSPPPKGGSPRIPYLLTVSSMEPNKNLPMLIEAFGRVATRWEGNLVVAGRRGRDLGRIQETVAAQGLGERVRIVTDGTDEDLMDLYSKAIAFAYPSLYEGFGLPLLEAMSNGLPVIANRLTSCPEVLGENAVLVDRPDAAAWALGLEQLLTDPSRLLRLAAGSKDRSAAFSWERAGQETWTAIEAALEGA